MRISESGKTESISVRNFELRPRLLHAIRQYGAAPMAVCLAVPDALDVPIGLARSPRDNALDNDPGEGFELRVTGSDGLGQRLLQSLARDRLAGGRSLDFLSQNQLLPMPLSTSRQPADVLRQLRAWPIQ